MATFDLDGYDVDSAETAQAASEPEPELSWRSDPAESHSDWTVVVRAEGVPDQKYHVHRCQLSVGPRRSDYFGAMFKTELSEGAARESKLDLQASAAAAFPKLLDYSYSGRIEFDDKNVAETTALMHLSHYLRMRELYDRTRTFVQSNLSSTTAPHYACEAYKYSMDKLVHAAITLCADTLDMVVKLFPRGFDALPTDLFTRVLEQSSKSSQTKSTRIAEYCRKNSDDVDKELFERFCQGIDKVNPTYAILLLRQAVDRGFVAGSKTQNISDICIRDAASGQVFNIFKIGTERPAWMRCINVNEKSYAGLPDSEKVKLLEFALTTATGDYEKLLSDHETLVSGREERISNLEKLVSDHQKLALNYDHDVLNSQNYRRWDPERHGFSIEAHRGQSRCTPTLYVKVKTQG